MNIQEMGKAELLDLMKADRSINDIGNDSSQQWKRAFELFTQAGGGLVDMGCSTCWTKVRDWMMA